MGPSLFLVLRCGHTYLPYIKEWGGGEEGMGGKEGSQIFIPQW